MSATRDRATIVGIGAAACAVCCAGPILGLLAAIGLGSVAVFALVGVAGLVGGLIIGAVLYGRRRRRASSCAPASDAVSIEPPRMMASKRLSAGRT